MPRIARKAGAPAPPDPTITLATHRGRVRELHGPSLVIALALLRLIDLAFAPIAIAASLMMRLIRGAGIYRLPQTVKVFRKLGVFPILDHYYEPLFNPAHLRHSLSVDRDLAGLDWNVGKQLDLLSKFDFNEELLAFPLSYQRDLQYFYRNGCFEDGDAEFLYNMIRYFKPRRIFEIGSGHSTLLATSAIEANGRSGSNYSCRHVCIEPYENKWLQQLTIELVRSPVERLDREFFGELEQNDILFIDSSHMIRPQGDVLFEFFEILPALKSGVLVHIHDIFSPKDYPHEWVFRDVRFWNEQYLLEAFMSFNSQFEIIGALNFLKHHYPQELARPCPVLRQHIDSREPGSFWIRRI